MNLYVLLDQVTTRLLARGAVYLGAHQVLTFAELRSRALKVAGYLRREFQVGDRIAVVAENKPEYVELLFGIWAAGMAAVPINAKLHVREVLQVLDDSGAVMAFVSEGWAKSLTGQANSAKPARLVAIGTTEYAAQLHQEWGGEIVCAPDSLAWLFYTSGTTGRSKGAMLSHRNLTAMALAHLADIEDADENCSLVHAAPMSHGSGLYMPVYLARGARQVVPESGGFSPDEFIDLCDAHPSCSAFLAPTMVRRLRLRVEELGRRPTNLRTIVYGGGPMYVDELKRSLKTFGDVFAQIYGQGESPMTITGLRRSDHTCGNDSVLGSVGYARTGVEVAVVSPDGTPLPQGEIGEIVCRGDVVMSGYWENPAATRDALNGGWLHTGDVGSFDERGYLTLRDRSKDVVISGGTNIYPREVEEALLAHDKVAEVSVVGQPDEEWGEIVVAFVVTNDGTALDPDVLDQHCKERIARFKRPRRYVFPKTLPKNNYGKVLKRMLREQLIQGA